MDTEKMYPAFVSVMFAFALGVLLIPIQALIPLATEPQAPNLLLGLLTLGVIMSLWWWYAIFFARVCPARTPLFYFLDFFVLTAVALAAKLWPSPSSWMIASVIAILLLTTRFILTAEYTVILGRWRAIMRQRPQFRQGDNYNVRLARSDRGILRWAYGILLACFGTLLILIIGGMIERGEQRSRLNPRFGGELATAGVDASLEGLAKDTDSSILFLLFELVVMSGVCYTVYVALRVPSVSISRNERSKDESDILHVCAHPTKLQVDYSYLIDSGIDVSKRVALLEQGVLELKRVCRSEVADRALELDGTRSRVHSSGDFMAQALAMSLRFGDNERDEIRKSANITYFMHWIDDLFDYGPCFGAIQNWLRRQDGNVEIPKDWEEVLRRPQDEALVKTFIKAERLIATDTVVREGQLRAGLQRLAIGAVLMKEQCLSESAYVDRLLKTHRRAFLKSQGITGANENLMALINGLNMRTLVLTAKPVQECWDVQRPDVTEVTVAMNFVLMMPVLEHNLEEEIGQMEVDPSWRDYARGEICRNDMNSIAEWLGGVAMPAERKRQVEFALKACADLPEETARLLRAVR